MRRAFESLSDAIDVSIVDCSENKMSMPSAELDTWLQVADAFFIFE